MFVVYRMPMGLRLIVLMLGGPPFIILIAAAKYGFEGVISAVFVCSVIIAIVMAAFRNLKHPVFYGSVLTAVLLGCYIYIPIWYMVYQAKTPNEHLLVAQAYATPGRLYGNEKAAWEHFMIAAEGGDAEAEFEVAGGYLYGWYGVTQDRENARQWMNASAAQGYKRAIDDLKDIDTAKF